MILIYTRTRSFLVHVVICVAVWNRKEEYKRNFHKKRMSWIRQYITVFFSGTASMFLGASLVHNLLQPDLTVPDIGSEGGMKSNLEGNKDSSLPPALSGENSGASGKA